MCLAQVPEKPGSMLAKLVEWSGGLWSFRFPNPHNRDCPLRLSAVLSPRSCCLCGALCMSPEPQRLKHLYQLCQDWPDIYHILYLSWNRNPARPWPKAPVCRSVSELSLRFYSPQWGSLQTISHHRLVPWYLWLSPVGTHSPFKDICCSNLTRQV